MQGTSIVVDELEIILKCQQGDRHAFGILVKKYMKRAYFIALALVGTHEAALDLSQDAFVRAYRSINKFDPQRKFFTWYYQILWNLCFNALRDKNRQAASFSEIGENQLAQISDPALNASQLVEQQEMQEMLWKALNALKTQDREIIVLKDFQDYSYKEIAMILRCPVGTVMSRLYTARKALKMKLEASYHE